MNTDFEQLDLNQTYSYADYMLWRFDERVELLKGKIIRMSPVPNRSHQKIVSFLNGEFYAYTIGHSISSFVLPDFSINVDQLFG